MLGFYHFLKCRKCFESFTFSPLFSHEPCVFTVGFCIALWFLEMRML